MSTTDTSCASCGARRAAGAYLCSDCNDELSMLLGDVPSLVDELTTTLTGQQRFEQQTPNSKSREQPLPFNLGASHALADLHVALLRIVELTHKAHVESVDHRDTRAGSSSSSMSRWLLWRVDGIAAQPWGDHALAELQRVSKHATRVIDRPAERAFAGPCDDCGRDLYAKHDASTVECSACGLTYDLAARREWLLRAVDDQLATATEIARALTSLDLPVTSERIWQWRHRDRIEQRSIDRRGRPMYRVGDVVTLLIEHAETSSA